MLYYAPSYSSGEWRRVEKYKHIMLLYDLNLNMCTHRLQLEICDEVNRAHLMYISGHAYTHKNIARFINSSKEQTLV